jgi:hypothetical protein
VGDNMVSRSLLRTRHVRRRALSQRDAQQGNKKQLDSLMEAETLVKTELKKQIQKPEMKKTSEAPENFLNVSKVS